MAYQINLGCIICGKCARHCPVEAISMGFEIFEINKKSVYHAKDTTMNLNVWQFVRLM
ncbi:hypothetical protein MASR1M45_11800 [Candidatus Kapaibacterium sp.]